VSVVVAAFVLAVMLVPLSSAASGDLTNHGGPVVRDGSVFVVFWLPAGRRFDSRLSNERFESFVRQGLASLDDAPWWATLSQYGVHGSLTVGGSWVDTTRYPRRATRMDPLHASDYRAAVRRALAANSWHPGIDHIYVVITARNTEACGLDKLIGSGLSVDNTPQPCSFPTSQRNACAGHAFFSIRGQPVVYAILPESSSWACVAGPGQSPNHDIRADDAITVGAALVAEAAVDPLGTGWYLRRTQVGLICNIPNPAPLRLRGGVYALFGVHSNAQHRCVHGYPPLELAASLSAPTVKAGARETLTVTTTPGAAITFTPDDGGDRGFETRANAQGRFTYSWVARPKPRRGSDKIMATLNGRSAWATVYFQIVA